MELVSLEGDPKYAARLFIKLIVTAIARVPIFVALYHIGHQVFALDGAGTEVALMGIFAGMM